MNFYHNVIPDIADGLSDPEDNDMADSVATTEVVLSSDEDEDPDDGIHYDVACPELSNTPPQPPFIRVRLPGVMSNAKRTRLNETEARTVCVDSNSTLVSSRMVPLDVWMFGVIPYADLSSLLQLSFTCRGLHHHLNDPQTIQQYLCGAWFIKQPHCSCARNQHRLDLTKICEFYWDRMGVHSARDLEVAIRSVGRGVDMYNDPRRSRPIRPRVDPDPVAAGTRHGPRRAQPFTKGVLTTYFEGLIVPVPRLLSVPVEAQRMGSVGYRTWKRVQDPDESVTEYQNRVYWRGCHNVDRTDSDRTTGFEEGPYVDPVKDYIQSCVLEGDRNPVDPSQDDENQSGCRAEQWARYQNHRGPVGVQSYPLEICISRTEIRGNTARRGLSDIDMLFLPAQRASTQGEETNAQMMMHTGLVYLHPVRYVNETGDFVPWCLSTIAVLRGVRQYMWYDAILYIIRRLNEFSLLVSTEVQNDLSMPQLMLRWEFLQRTQVRMEAQWPPEGYVTATTVPRPPSRPSLELAPPSATHAEELVALQKARNDRAGRLLRCPLYVSFNRHIQQKILEYEQNLNVGSTYSFRDGYLISMVPSLYDHPPTPHTELGLMQQLHRMAWLADYVVEFAGSIGPRVDHLSDFRRNRTLSAYLGVAASLLMFAPGYTDRPHWCPRTAHLDAGSIVPRLDLTQNHRFRYYRDFVSARQHFFDPPAPLYNPL